MMNAIQKLSCELAAAERKQAAHTQGLFANRHTPEDGSRRPRPSVRPDRAFASRPRRPAPRGR